MQEPSERNRAIVAHRDAGHTRKQTAEHFHLSVERVRRIERRTREYLQAAEMLKSDPDNIMLLALTGHIHRFTASGLQRAGIDRIPDLRGAKLCDFLRLPNVSLAGALGIARLAAERGINVEGLEETWPR